MMQESKPGEPLCLHLERGKRNGSGSRWADVGCVECGTWRAMPMLHVMAMERGGCGETPSRVGPGPALPRQPPSQRLCSSSQVRLLPVPQAGAEAVLITNSASYTLPTRPWATVALHVVLLRDRAKRSRLQRYAGNTWKDWASQAPVEGLRVRDGGPSATYGTTVPAPVPHTRSLLSCLSSESATPFQLLTG
jgi:hypothetical protein